jgi:type II secretory pathway pseudopilin PulG
MGSDAACVVASAGRVERVERLRRRAHTGGGFTLVEMLVAVGAVALIAVGLSKLFASAGDTLKAGRRISNLNGVAATLERQMRDDFQNMSRRGVLVIRHKVARTTTGPIADAIPLRADDRSGGRARRIDEVTFFREGAFGSAREPLSDTREPQGSAAQIYYGHGLRATIPPRGANDATLLPEHFDDNARDGVSGGTGPVALPSFGAAGPNQYASDWILTRRQFAMIPPQNTSEDAPPVGLGAGAGAGADSVVQIGLQPAGADVFRVIEWNVPVDAGANSVIRQPPRTGTIRGSVDASNLSPPRRASGLVDIVSTDLPTMRARIMGAQDPRLASLEALTPNFNQQTVTSVGDSAVTYGPAGTTAGSSRGSVRFAVQDPQKLDDDFRTVTGRDYPTLGRMKQWMMQLLPAGDLPGDVRSDPQTVERRVRAELAPPDLTGRLYAAAGFEETEPWRRTDQAMLSASNLVVGCTEFIVEWSFGNTYSDRELTTLIRGDLPASAFDAPSNALLDGATIWHGLPRTADIDGDEVIDATEFVAHPYVPDQTSQVMFLDWTPQGTGLPTPFRRGGTPAATNAFHIYESGLIHEPAPATRTDWRFPNQRATDALRDGRNDELYSLFGYVDPTFWYRDPAWAAAGSAGAPYLERQPGEPDSAAWVWPKLIRVTMTLVDPSEPLREETFQFIFSVPDAEGGRAF